MLSIELYVLFKLLNNPMRRYYYFPHLIAEDTEASSDATCQGRKAGSQDEVSNPSAGSESLRGDSAARTPSSLMHEHVVLHSYKNNPPYLTDEKTEAQSRKQPMQSHTRSLRLCQTPCYSPRAGLDLWVSVSSCMKLGGAMR